MTGSPGGQADQDLEELLSFLRDARGFDFTGYKRSSLARRIRKRMNDISIAGYISTTGTGWRPTRRNSALFSISS
jgi:two-component system, chemotaxis family, CheB/CheR fusion protein